MSGLEGLQILMGILVTVSLGLAGWALSKVVELSSSQSASNALAEERKEEFERRCKELKEDFVARIAEVREENSERFGEVKSELSRIHDGISALHKRFDRHADHNGG